jgi:hypothetical protein
MHFKKKKWVDDIISGTGRSGKWDNQENIELKLIIRREQSSLEMNLSCSKYFIYQEKLKKNNFIFSRL